MNTESPASRRTPVTRAWLTGPIIFVALGLGAALSFLADRVGSITRFGAMTIGAVGALAVILQPDIGLLGFIFIVFTFLSDVLINYYSAPSIAKPFVALLVGVILIRVTLYRDRITGLGRPLVLFGLYALLYGSSLLYAANNADAETAWVGFIKDAIMALAVICLLQRAQTWNKVIWTLLAAGSVMGTISVFQYFTGTFGNNYFGFGQWIIGPSGEHRLAGPMGDPNYYAQLLVVIFPVALDRLWNEKRRAWRLAAGWTGLVTVLAIVLTGSRGGFLALAATLVLLFLRKPPAPLPFIATVLAAFLVLGLAPANYIDRLQSLTLTSSALEGNATTDQSIVGRASETEAAWLMFRDYPILGVGFGNYPDHYQEYSRQIGLDSRLELRQPHSLYLEIAAETGLVGLVLFCLLMVEVFGGLRRAAKALVKMGQRDAGGEAAALAIGYVGYFAAGLFLHNAYSQTYWMLIGIALAAANIAQRELLAQRNTPYDR